VLVLSEVYIYFNLKVAFKESKFRPLVNWVYWASLLFVIASISLGIYSIVSGKTQAQNRTWAENFIIGLTFTIIASKLFLAFLFLLVDFSRLLTFLSNKIYSLFSSNPNEFSLESRRKFLTQSALALASLPFASFIYGITWGKYNFKVRKHTLHFPNLPQAFEGYKIVHISDIHAGSFDSMEDVKRGIDLINEQQPDLIAFTGDLVNNVAEEIDPYIALFKNLTAKDGVVSCLGNHDYGDYIPWPSEEDKRLNFERLQQKHIDMNFRLLMNTHQTINRDGEHLVIAGVENWGLPPFPQLGDLDKALHQSNNSFTILLSHDPTHWDEKAVPHQRHIDLTLSGHTHGMQFGIEIPGIKWSPVKYKYDKWAGIYESGKQYLHVNRGFGFLGFPGRVGIWPEITVIELRKSAAV
jgi:uncharacterized protein